MKKEDYTGKSADELKKSLIDLKKEQFNARFQASGGQLDNTASLRTIRRNIARVKTLLNAQKHADGKAA